MQALLLIIGLLAAAPAGAADFKVTLANTMMTGGANTGAVNLGQFDAFQPSTNCATFTSPNTCNVIDRNAVAVSMEFTYEIEITSGATSIDLDFDLDNGNSGGDGAFTNLQSPNDLMGLVHNDTGSFNVDFHVPLFGPDSRLSYGMTMTVDVVVNP